MAFLENSWYCASWSSDLRVEPAGLKILDDDLVFYRKEDGTAVAISGICPHRFAPLWRGKVTGDLIQCAYHGLEFDGTGRCVRNPHGRGIIPPSAHLRSYPLVEQGGALWVWMGDPARADPTKIPVFEFVADRTRWAGLTGHLRIEANYQLVIDNLLDLTHAAYIHVDTLGVKADEWIGETRMDYEFKVHGDVINSDYVFRNSPPTPMLALFNDMKVGDIYTPMALYPASTLILDMTMTDPGMPKSGGVHMPSAHFLVPETEKSCHYFYAISRSIRLEDEAITTAMGDLIRHAFVSEDAPIIRDCQIAMGDREFFSMKPVILETDVAAIQARRVLAKMMRRERDGVPSGEAGVDADPGASGVMSDVLAA